MHGICLDYDLQEWFDFKIPKTKISPDFIYNVLEEETNFAIKPNAKVVWLGGKPTVTTFTKSKKGSSWEMMSLTFYDKKETFTIQTGQKEGQWLVQILETLSFSQPKKMNFQELKTDFEIELTDFELFWFSKPVEILKNYGLLVL
jgi:hypothetical protein